jgi:8-oxo-dGTP diphosphatase
MLVSISTLKEKLLKKNLVVSIALFIKDVNSEGFKIWTQERLEEGPLLGMLEFPGGKIEAHESPVDACRREVFEEVGVELSLDTKLILFKYQDYSFGTKNICLHVFISNFKNLPADKGQWLTINYREKSQSLSGKIPPINHVIIDDLAVYMEKEFQAHTLEFLWKI